MKIRMTKRKKLLQQMKEDERKIKMEKCMN